MKRKTNALLSSLFLAFIVLSFDGYYDYANGQELEVFTDKQIYNLGDTVVIFGTVPVATATFTNEPVKIELFEPSNTMHPIGQPIPQDGRYKLEFGLLGELAREGTWTVIASYAGQEALTSFQVVAAGNDIIRTGYLLVNTIKDKYFGSEPIIGFGTVPFVREGLIVHISVDQEVSYIPPPESVYTAELEPASDGTYNFEFIMPSSAENSRYTVQAIYDDLTPVQTTFDYLREIPEIRIDSVTPNKPRWGLPVNVSGIAIVPQGVKAIVTIDWGDGTVPTSGIPVVGDRWSAGNHIYDDNHLGDNKIIAKLYEDLETGLGAKLNESEHTANVLKHSTNLTIDPINKLVNNLFTVSGRLSDLDAGEGISGKSIIVTVSTLDLVIPEILTNSSGYYQGFGNLSGDLLADELLFQTHFAGDDLYFASDSNVRTYVITQEPTNGDEIPLPVIVIPPVVAGSIIIGLMNTPKPKRKLNIRRDASTVVTLQAEVDVKSG